MSTVDERIVRMKFDNAAFEQGIAQTRDSLGRFTKTLQDQSKTTAFEQGITRSRDALGKFTKSLQLEGASKGLEQVDAAAKKVSFQGLEKGVNAIGDKFKAMSVVGVTALATITQKAVSAGLQFAKSFTTAPIISGFHEYETNMNSIQTILANTGLEGQAGLDKVNKALNELNHYSDQTIYNFSEMAKNIGTFTAAGVSLDTSTAAIKGIANLAAVSGSNAEQASGAMYQLSQALAAGKLTLEDWSSVVTANMGGKVFKDALMDTARVHGVAIDAMVKKEGGFTKTLQKGWLTSKILTETLAKFTGDLSAKQLASQGYSKKQIADIMKMAKTAKDAATKVKTFSQLIDTLKEAVGSGWTQTWTTLFGNFNEARSLFTGISNTLGGFITSSANARNKVLSDWKEMGGRKVLIDGIKNAFNALISVMKPIRDAFRQIFPATTGKQLYDMTVAFRDFTAKLKIGSDTADKLKRTFAGVFAIFGIAWDVIKGVGSVLAHLFGVVTSGSGGFLGLTARIGDFLVKVKEAIEKGNALTKFFQILGTILGAPIILLQKMAGAIGSLFDKFDGKKAASGISGVTKQLGPFGKLAELARSAWSKLFDLLGKVGDNFGGIEDGIVKALSTIGPAISKFFGNLDFSQVLDSINTGLLAGLFILIKGLINKFKDFGDTGGDFIDSITGPFDALTDTLSAMQGVLKATTLLEIAAAIGIMAISVQILSKIDAEGLTRATTALTVMFAQLLGSLAIFTKFIGTAGFAKMPFVMGSLILLAAAVDILASAVTKLAKLDWNDLSKGLTGVTLLLAGLVGALKFMPPTSGLISTGLGLVVLAGAIKILVSAVTDLSGMSWADMAKGLVGVGALLGSLVLFTKFASADKAGVLQGAGLILLAAGIKILASAVKDLSGLSWQEMAKGLVAMAGSLAIVTGALMLIPPTAAASAAGVLITALSLGKIADALDQMGKMSWGAIGKGLTTMLGALAIIAAALYVIPPTAVLGAAGVLVVALSLNTVANVLAKMAEMSWEDIGKAMVVLAGSLGLIAGAVMLMSGALPGAAAMVIVTASLLLLLPVLVSFSQMSWEEIAKGLAMLAGVFIVIGAAGLLLAPIVPVIALLGLAIAALGVGLLAAGGGIFLFAAGLTALAAAGTAGAAAVIGIVSGLIGLIPKLMEQIGLGVIAFAKVIATAGPAITKAITVVLTSLINAIAKITPLIVTTLAKLMLMMLQTMLKYVPSMVSTGLKLLTGILNGIASNIGKVVTAATNVIVAFLNAIGKNQPRIVDSGVKLIINFINGVAKAINSNSAALGRAGANLATAIVSGMVKGLASGAGTIASKAASVARGALDAAKGVLGIHSPSKEFEKIGNYVNDGFRKGLDGNKGQIDTAFKDLQSKLKTAMQNSAHDVDVLEARLKRLTSARHRDNSAIAATRKELAQAKKEHAAEAAAYDQITKKLNKQHAALDLLAAKYDKATAALKRAQDTLANAIKTRDDFNKQITDQYSDMVAPTGETKVTDYIKNLEDQIEKTKEFSNTLQRLRALGLNDETYKDLLAQGPDALPFANELLAGGKGEIDKLNDLSKQLDVAGSALGKSASTNLYQAGVDAAEGLVKGLQANQKKIEQQMDKIADAMVKAIKKALKIKSPSRVFMEVGEFSAKGVAKGLDNMSGLVGEASAGTGKTAVDALRKSMAGFSDLITSDVDIRPTITPVLDLSTVKKDASKIGGFLTASSISADSAYAKAKAISAARASDQAAVMDSAPAPTASYSYVQNNYSPKALSSADIYRGTKNQLSQAKGALP